MNRLKKKALDYFHDPDLAAAWMDSKFAGLGNRSPRQCANNEAGEEFVLNYFRDFFKSDSDDTKN
jgi:uncharacterized protein (DUF2384 family)